MGNLGQFRCDSSSLLGAVSGRLQEEASGAARRWAPSPVTVLLQRLDTFYRPCGLVRGFGGGGVALELCLGLEDAHGRLDVTSVRWRGRN